MRTISELLDENCIELNLHGKKKKDVIEELIEMLYAAGKIDESEKYLKEILQREKLSSTGIGRGVAIPHKLHKDIKETVIAFGRRPQGVNFDSIDRQPVYLIFLVLGTEGQHTEHLKLLSKLSRLLHDESFTQRLLNAQSTAEVISLIREQETA